jgi:hypothetical protein
MTDERKPRSAAKINPSNVDLAARHVGRIGRLRDAVAKAEARGDVDKAASLNAEIARRLDEVAEIKAELDSL